MEKEVGQYIAQINEQEYEVLRVMMKYDGELQYEEEQEYHFE